MIEYTTGDLLKSNADALVNPVNCVGVMGKGLALQFKKSFPENFKEYQTACKNNDVHVGCMFVTRLPDQSGYIINFPTKSHWRGKSKREFICNGLVDLKKKITLLNIKSIAIPPIGAGLGGLNWRDVKKMIEEHLDDLKDVRIILYEPV
ncbi:MAG: macro domain-containing protein [bacterium]|nr:macro domain-containing protein [bacterium]